MYYKTKNTNTREVFIMKKRFLKGMSILLVTSMVASMLVGCGAAKESTRNDADTSPATEEACTADEAYESSASATGNSSKREDACESESAVPKAYEDMYEWNEACDEACVDPQYEYQNSEEYEKAEENGFLVSAINPLSTFSADVDTASYANVRRMIEDGYTLEMINPEAVRPEEFLNYFSYDLAKPKKGELFGVTTEVGVCPWNDKHELMMVGMATEPIDMSTAPDSNLVFLLDVSGSMSDDDKLPLLQKSFKELTAELGKNDTVSIVTYASGVETVLEGVSGDHKDEICDAIDRLYAGGGTNGEGGIQRAYELAEANFIKGGNNRVILATDGDLNIGISSADELEKFIGKKKESGVYLSVLGFGTGNLKDNKMERLADCGNGNYSYIDSLFEAKKVLVEEMGASLVTVAEDVKLQVEFNPQKVNAYRLIGYENRMMSAADFNDDKKDAGEIGAGHSVIALYEIIPAGSTDEIKLKYQDNKAKEDVKYTDYATVSVRYKNPGKDKSQLVSYVAGKDAFTKNPSDNFVFASIVAEFAMILSDSSNKADASFEHIMNTYKELDIHDEYKEEFYYLVKQMAKRS